MPPFFPAYYHPPSSADDADHHPGCGTGKPVFAAAAMHPWSRCIGMEILGDLHGICLKALKVLFRVFLLVKLRDPLSFDLYGAPVDACRMFPDGKSPIWSMLHYSPDARGLFSVPNYHGASKRIEQTDGFFMSCKGRLRLLRGLLNGGYSVLIGRRCIHISTQVFIWLFMLHLLVSLLS